MKVPHQKSDTSKININGEFFSVSRKDLRADIPQTEFETINIYPNPVDRFLSIDGSIQPTDVVITDLCGKDVLVDRSGNASVDLSVLNSGTYVLRVYTTEGNIITKKIIKK